MDNHIWQFLIFTGVCFTALIRLNVRCKQFWPKRYRHSIFKTIISSLISHRVKLTPLPALDLGDAASAWVERVLQIKGLRLNYSAPELAKRLACKVHKDWHTQIGATDEVGFFLMEYDHLFTQVHVIICACFLWLCVEYWFMSYGIEYYWFFLCII